VAKMNLSTRRKNVRRLAKQFGMQEGDVREMLAIESGLIDGDITIVDGPQPRSSRLLLWKNNFFSALKTAMHARLWPFHARRY